ncbi:hypothetical protein BK816_03120 [Boudabousia tangfeifanii]|uniref:Arginase n=1 Tax=Boudabousia tangfeifanii TaxID=1912795 RepID=A0A1D9MJC9_9ACTO|nr:arginase family protein [Boudabousia tangfeifanii]AOZ72407.1 hypothetical protein BK816_03120 [Boudabousia tangfeifanii]
MSFINSNLDLISTQMRLGTGRLGDSGSFPRLVESGLLEKLENKGFSLTCHEVNTPPVTESEIYASHDHLKYLAPIMEVDKALEQEVYSSLQKGHLPFTIGGDHALAIGTLSGLLNYCQENNEKPFVVWFDAHTDINTAKGTLSGNVHGIPLAVAIGYDQDIFPSFYQKEQYLDPSALHYVGIRSVDDFEQNVVEQHSIPNHPMSALKQLGDEWPKVVVEQIVTEFEKSKATRLHLSFDLDGVDPSFAPSVFTDVPDGVPLPQALEFVTRLKEALPLKSGDFVEFDPGLDDNNNTGLKAALAVLDTILD